MRKDRKGRPATAAPPSRQPEAHAAMLSPRERFAAIVHKFVTTGGRTDQIANDLNQQFPGGRWTRESIYAELRNGIANGYVSVDTARGELADRLRDRARLRSAAVISTVYFDQVAALAARQLLAILADLREQSDARKAEARRTDGRKPEAKTGDGRRTESRKPEVLEPVRIGFASGHSMSRVARTLAMLLRTTDLAMPGWLQFHALSSTFDVTKLHEDPNFFLARFDEPEIAERCNTRITFVGLSAPSQIEPGDLPRIRSGRGLAVPIAEAKKLDIVVTGASDIDDPRSTMFEFYEKETAEKAHLKEQGCAGHLLYLPIGPSGPIPTSRLKYVMPTALDLTDLADRVHNGTRVMLVSGPSDNLQPKKIVATILRLRPALITDVVIDERTARHALDSDLGPPRDA